MSDIAMGALVVELRAQSGQLLAEFSKAAQAVTVSTSSMSARLGAFEKGLSIVAAAGAAAVAGLAAASIREFTKFDDAMLKSLANMRDVSDQMKGELAAAAREFSIQQGESADDIAASYLTMSKAGLSAAESIQALSTVEAYGQVTDLSMNESSKALLQTMRSLGIASGDTAEKMQNMQRVSDVIIEASQRSSASFEELTASLQGKFGVALRSTNTSIEQGVASLMALSDAGIKGGMAGQMMAIVFKELQSNAISNKEAWDQFGVSAYDAQGKLRPLADIVDQLDGVLASASDEQKKMTLEMLGFSNRSVEAIQALLGTSDKLREYQGELEKSNGVTKRTADVLETSLGESFKKMSAAVSEILRLFGEELDPLVRSFTTLFRDAATGTGQWKGEVHELAVGFKDGLVFAIKAAMEVVRGWHFIIKAGQVVFAQFYEITLRGVNLLVQGFKKYTETLIENYNSFVRVNNAVARFHPGVMKLTELNTPQWLTDVANATQGYAAAASEATRQTTEELNAFIQSKAASELLAEQLKKEEAEKVRRAEESKRLAEEQAKAAGMASDSAVKEAATLKKVNEELSKFFAQLDKHDIKKYTSVSPEVVKLKMAIQDPWIAGQKELKKYQEMLKNGAISQEEFNRALHSLNLKGELADPFEEARFKLEQYNRSLRDGVVTYQEYVNGVNTALAQMNPELFGAKTIGPGANQITSLPANYSSGMGEVDELTAMMQKEQALQESYDRQKSMLQEMTTYSVQQERDRIKSLEVLDANYLKQKESFERQRMTFMLTTASSSFDQMAAVMKDGFGEQSGAYKAAFAISKAFAIADASVKIGQGIAAAASLPFPANIGAMASVVSATASLISNISSVVLSFEGGGNTPSGPRSGGVDGRGGFFAIMHPDETVIDNTRTTNRGGDTQVNVLNYGDNDITTQTRTRGDGTKMIDLIVEKSVSRLTADINQGKGVFPRAMQSAYPNLVRKGGR